MEAPDQIEAIELGKLSAKTTPTTKEGKTCLDLKQSGGGWTTFPFIIVALGSLTLAASGWASNLVVFLITEMNVKSIKATQITNVVLGCFSLFPVAGAILSDSFFGPFFVITVFSVVSLLGVILLTIIATVHSLSSSPCTNASLICETPSTTQYTVLYAALALVSLGLGGTRFTIATIGANQYDRARDQGIFFNWFYLTIYITSAISFTAIIYVEENVSWGLGFGICIIANAIGLMVFLLGNRFYRHVKPEGSPFTSIVRVMVAAIRKRKMSGTFGAQDYYYGSIGTRTLHNAPSKRFRSLNCAALKTDDRDVRSNGSYSRSWSLCTVEEVEDLKTLIKIIPIWSSGIFTSAPIAMSLNLVVLQALTMDRHIGPHFKIPAGTFIVFNLVGTAISIVLVDRILIPMWQKLTRRPLTLLQRVGIGHIVNIIGIIGAALIEARRLHVVRAHHLVDEPRSVVPMSALWLIFPLVIVGFGEGFLVGQVTLYYQEFPVSLRSTSSAMFSVLIGIGFYLSTGITNLIRRITGWLPDNINEGRLDNVFWLLAVIGVVNFGYYLVCAKLFKPKTVEEPIGPSERAI